MAEMKYTVKDSVFTYLFKQPEYARKLYLALHPEDTNVTEISICNVQICGQQKTALSAANTQSGRCTNTRATN